MAHEMVHWVQPTGSDIGIRLEIPLGVEEVGGKQYAPHLPFARRRGSKRILDPQKSILHEAITRYLTERDEPTATRTESAIPQNYPTLCIGRRERDNIEISKTR